MLQYGKVISSYVLENSMNLKKIQLLFFVLFACLPSLVFADEDIISPEKDEYTMYDKYQKMNKEAIDMLEKNSGNSIGQSNLTTDINVTIANKGETSKEPLKITVEKYETDGSIEEWNTATSLATIPAKYKSAVLLNDARGVKKHNKQNQANVFSIIQEIHYLKSAIRDMFLDKDAYIQKSPYKDVSNISLIQKNIIPLNFLSPAPKSVNEIQNITDPWGFTIVNQYNGAINIEGVGPDYKFFRITYTGLPSDVCVALLLAKWEDNYLGTMWIGSNGSFYSWARELQANPMPISPKDAYAVCKNGGYFQIGFK